MPSPSSPLTKARNKRIAEEHGCILTGDTSSIDPAHWPVRQSHGAGWGLLEFVPLRRDWHRRLDQGEAFACRLVAVAAKRYHESMLRAHPDEYLGPPWRIREVEGYCADR